MFVGIDQLGLFIMAGLLLNLTPGPDVLYIVSNGVRGGRRGGVAAALGIGAGCCVHIIAAAVGLGALIAASALTFTVLKWLGAAYLIYIGLRLLFAPASGGKALAELQGAAPSPGAETVSGPTRSIPRWRCSSWRSCHSSSPMMRPTRPQPFCCWV